MVYLVISMHHLLNIKEHTFVNSEQAFMWAKVKTFSPDSPIATQILNAKTPEEAKRLGRSRGYGFDQATWDSKSDGVMFEVLIWKFSKIWHSNKFCLIQTNLFLSKRLHMMPFGESA